MAESVAGNRESLKALREANPDVDPTTMRVGTVLVIPEE